MVVEYLITIKTLTIEENEKGIDKNSKYFFVEFQGPFSQKIINIHLYKYIYIYHIKLLYVQ